MIRLTSYTMFIMLLSQSFRQAQHFNNKIRRLGPQLSTSETKYNTTKQTNKEEQNCNITVLSQWGKHTLHLLTLWECYRPQDLH